MLLFPIKKLKKHLYLRHIILRNSLSKVFQSEIIMTCYFLLVQGQASQENILSRQVLC